MAEPVPTSERVVDRKRELKQFMKILSSASQPRVVTVQAGSGTGKSWLLELLEERATDADALAVRAQLVEDAELMWLVEEIGERFGVCGAPLTGFETLNRARRTYDHSAFGLQPPPEPRVGLSIINSEFRNSPVTGAELPTPPEGWPDGHERAARAKCLDALLADLRGLSHERTVVLLLDQYERATEEVERWLGRALSTHLLNATVPFGALILVVASNKVVFPTTVAKGLLRRSKGFLCSIPLSRWTDADIDEWLQQLNIPNRHVWVPLVRSLLDEGASLLDLKMLAGRGREIAKGAA